MECSEITHILFATDDSVNAQHAFTYVACIAQKHSAKVTLLHVVQEFRDRVAFDFGIERSVAAKKWFSVSNEYFEEVRERFRDRAKILYQAKQVDVEEVIVVKGNPVKMILQTAKEKSCDLIVMGGKGKGGLEDTLMGNTTSGVLQRATVPVLVTRYKTDK